MDDEIETRIITPLNPSGQNRLLYQDQVDSIINRIQFLFPNKPVEAIPYQVVTQEVATLTSEPGGKFLLQYVPSLFFAMC